VARFVDETGPFCKLLAWLRRAARGDPAPLTPVPPLADGRGGREWVFCGDAASSLVSDVVGLSTRAAVEALVRQMRVMRAKLIEEGLESHAVRTHPPRRTTRRLARRACSRADSGGECASFCRRLWDCRRLRQVRSDTINLIEATLVRLAFLLSADDAAHYRLIVRRGAVRRWNASLGVRMSLSCTCVPSRTPYQHTHTPPRPRAPAHVGCAALARARVALLRE
jgi:hypothetical protein